MFIFSEFIFIEINELNTKTSRGGLDDYYWNPYFLFKNDICVKKTKKWYIYENAYDMVLNGAKGN